ncbi:hypothetical protein Ga0123462_0488 [Mariprofundus ferrinatatus]|uniref:Uncharacterized protein n=1 Tax=Mariprofundus ferrinatatus TaxID=1921087 RepID=A0A2K8L285_9PROT|nr:hypothetical protein [Mariprofundus ferrinatatus]ATX81363.1 hypothetical protein Ga0123462_0488 [Mariprofundus ferrinatatus]
MGQVIPFPASKSRTATIVDDFIQELAVQIGAEGAESFSFMRAEAEKVLDRYIKGINLEMNLMLPPTATSHEVEAVANQANSAMTKIREELSTELFGMMAEIVTLKEQLRILKRAGGH